MAIVASVPQTIGQLCRPSSLRRLPIANGSRKQPALGTPQLLEETRDTRLQLQNTATDLPNRTASLEESAQSSSISDRQASHQSATTSKAAVAVDDDDDDAPTVQPSLADDTTPSIQGSNGNKNSVQRATETVFIGEVPGFGWSEGFLPMFRTEQRVIEPLKKRRGRKKKVETEAEAEASRDEQEPEELETFLIELGVPKTEVQQLMDTAVAWRVTPGGRLLIDRRRQSRLARNVRIVAEYLQMECGIPVGPQGIGAVFLQVPELMLCKPSSNDRWDRRAVELAAYRLKHGHCNVPETWEPNIELGIWVKRLRVARAAGQLSDERLQILERMGFEFGDVAQVTEEWELRFDQLIDWMLWHGENGQTFSWVGIDWGARGGITARELALWMALQREFRRRQLLPAEAELRFEALHVEWEAVGETAAAVQWMRWLGKLLYLVERRCFDTRRPPVKTFGRRIGSSSSSGGGSSTGGDDVDGNNEEKEINTSAAIARSSSRGPGSGAGRVLKARVAATMEARREALLRAPPTEEPGLAVWVVRQRWLWRQGLVSAEQARMLHLAGVDMDVYTPAEWQEMAHATAAVLQRSKIVLKVTQGAALQLAGDAEIAELREAAENARAALLPSTNTVNDDVKRHHMKSSQVKERSRGGSGGDSGGGGGGGSRRLRVRRWLQTQRALFSEGRISPGQLRYLRFLGITWILSDEVMRMDDVIWHKCRVALEKERISSRDVDFSSDFDFDDDEDDDDDDHSTAFASVAFNFDLGVESHHDHDDDDEESVDRSERFTTSPERLSEWLEHQKGLHALGLLSPSRAIALETSLQRMGLSWEFERAEDGDDWDLRLSQLLQQSLTAGSLQDVGVENEQFTGLSEWLAAQKVLAANGELAEKRATQLMALGVLLQFPSMS